MRLSGISPPGASFHDRSLTMFLKNSSVNGLNAKFLLQFINFRVRPKFINNYINSSKILNFGSCGHSNTSKFLVID